jgi:peptidyl-prolyl cis-trans isomerase D
MVQGNNSGLINLGDDHSAVIHVDKHIPAAARPLTEVRVDVDKRIVEERTVEASRKAADTLLARLRQGNSMQDIATETGATLQVTTEAQRSMPSVPAALLAQAFLMPHPVDGKPVYTVVDMPDGSAALLALDKVQPGDVAAIPAEQHTALRQQMAQAYAAEATRELIAVLRSKVKIKYNKSLM